MQMIKHGVSPGFIGIGFQRCATSWLNVMLAEHPQIGKPRTGVHFFNRHFERGPRWYEAILAEYAGGSASIVGEFSTTYSYPEYASDVADRIAALYPETSILASVRNPVERVYSDYLRGRGRGDIDDPSLRSALENHSELIERSYYGKVLELYYERFDAARILVICFDDITERPAAVLKQVYSFLGLDSDFIPEGADRRLGATYETRSIGFERSLRAMQKVGRHMKRIPGVGWLSEQGYHRRVVNGLRSLNATPVRDHISQSYPSLIARFEIDIRKTMSLTGLDLQHWLDRPSNS